METPQKLTKAQKRELRKQQWALEAQKAQKNQQYKKIGIWAGVFIVVVIAILGLAWMVNSPSSTSTSSLAVPAPSIKDLFTTVNPTSKVVLTEYGDFQCPACASYHPVVKQLLAEEGDKIYFVYRYFPLTQVHPNAHISAQAGYAAYKQGKFWEMNDLLFEGQNDWASLTDPKNVFIEYAKSLGLNTDKFSSDMNSSEASSFVDNSLKDAVSSGLNSTPSFFINNKKIDSPNTYDDFKKLIENELNKK
jgi:protein-disulfide isomerase